MKTPRLEIVLAKLSLVLLGFLTMSHTYAGTIFSYSVNINAQDGNPDSSLVGYVGPGVTTPAVRPYFSYLKNGRTGLIPTSGDGALFTELTLTNADVGSEFVRTPSDAFSWPHYFPVFAEQWTDGVDGGTTRISVFTLGSSGSISSGRQYLGASDADLFAGSENVDLLGFTVTEVRLRVESLNIIIDENFFQHTRGEFTFEIEVEEENDLLFLGPGTTPLQLIPTPAAGVLCLIGSICCLLQPRRPQGDR